jgi:hypothetical protein
MDEKYSTILSKISTIDPEKKFKFASKVGLQTYILYGTAEKKESPRKVRFLFVKKDFSCNRIYGVFHFHENKIISQELFKSKKEENIQSLLEEMENTDKINFTCELF